MAKSRNERRRLAQARLIAKSTRIAKAELGRLCDERKDIVRENNHEARSPYGNSILSRLSESAPRFVSSGKGTGSMSASAVRSMQPKLARQRTSNYAQPLNVEDRSKWPVIDKKP